MKLKDFLLFVFYYYSKYVVLNTMTIMFVILAIFVMLLDSDSQYIIYVGYLFFFSLGLYIGFVYAIYSVKYLQKRNEDLRKEAKDE